MNVKYCSVGIGIGLLLYGAYDKFGKNIIKKIKINYPVSFNELLKNEKHFELINPYSIQQWYKLNGYDNKDVNFLAFLTEKNIKNFNIINIPNDIDLSHYILQGIINNDLGKKKFRLISFNESDENLINLFDRDSVFYFNENEVDVKFKEKYNIIKKEYLKKMLVKGIKKWI